MRDNASDENRRGCRRIPHSSIYYPIISSFPPSATVADTRRCPRYTKTTSQDESHLLRGPSPEPRLSQTTRETISRKPEFWGKEDGKPPPQIASEWLVVDSRASGAELRGIVFVTENGRRDISGEESGCLCVEPSGSSPLKRCHKICSPCFTRLILYLYSRCLTLQHRITIF